MSVFVDTSAFVAYFNRDDPHHAVAVGVMQALAQEKALLVTTNYTMLETTALLQRRLGLAALLDFQRVVVPFLTVIWVDAALHDLGVTAVLAANKRQLSLVDCISFIVCRRQGIQQVFAYDQHFTEQGFALLNHA